MLQKFVLIEILAWKRNNLHLGVKVALVWLLSWVGGFNGLTLTSSS